MDLGSRDRRDCDGRRTGRLSRRPDGRDCDDDAGWQCNRLSRLLRLRLLPVLRPVLATADRVPLLQAVRVALVGTRPLGLRRALSRSHARPGADDAYGNKAGRSEDYLAATHQFASAWLR